MNPGATLEGRFAFALPDGEVLDSPDTSVIERDVKVFRTGTFTDMRGRTKTYTTDDLDTAVQNFYALRDNNVLPNVPLRVDHTMSMKDVGGYVVAVRRSGNFLLADLEFTDETVHAKYRKKHLRNRSLEIGQYVTNEGAAYNPVVLGLAFVDLPAVEGLYHLAIGEDMGTEPDTQEPDTEDTDPVTPDEVPETPPVETPVAETPAPTPVPEPVAAHGRHQSAEAFAFRVEGGVVTDPAAVQAHINTLEAFRQEAANDVRTTFIDGLAEARKITGPQAEQFRKIVVDMSPEMFATFRAGFDGDTPAGLFARHETNDGGGDGGGANSVEDRVSVLEGVVQNFRRLGKSEAEIEALQPYKDLQTLRSQITGS